MGLRINTNVAALRAQSSMMSVTGKLRGNFSRLSSGLRIATAADDAAGLGISERMRAQIRSLSVAHRNAQDGVSMLETAEGGLSQISESLIKLRELTVKAASGSTPRRDRWRLRTEQLLTVRHINDIANTLNFNGIQLLDGPGGNPDARRHDIHVGVNSTDVIELDFSNDLDGGALGISGINLMDENDARDAIGIVDTAMSRLDSVRALWGASQNRLESAMRSILTQRENLTASESRIRDVDVAHETAELTRNSILQQSAIAVLSQANAQPEITLQLLG